MPPRDDLGVLIARAPCTTDDLLAHTTRLLPRLLKGRTWEPVFVTHRQPVPGKVPS